MGLFAERVSHSGVLLVATRWCGLSEAAYSGGEAPAKGDIPQWSRERNEGNQRVVGWTKFNVSTFNAISYVILEPTLSGFAPTSRAINAERWAIVATQKGDVPDMMCPLPHHRIDAHELNAP